LLRWTVEPSRPYEAGTVLAEIRTADDLIVGLTATDDGALLEPLPPPGTLVGPHLAVAARRPPEALAGDPPAPVRTHGTAGSYLLRADHQVLLECAAGGSSVTSVAAATGEVLGVFTPEPADLPAAPDGGRLFVDPEGRPALVAWDAGTGVSVFDVQSGKLTTRIREAVGGRRFLVDESGWRLAVESEGRAAVGRYRRSTITIWDLHTGSRLHRATDGGWDQRHPEFRLRSAADGFGLEAAGAGLAATVRADAVLVTDVATGLEVFRTAMPADTQARVAFDADGQRLLINTETSGRSSIDVFQV
jgi:DNA-binding beta-propeller fold protein YncE